MTRPSRSSTSAEVNTGLDPAHPSSVRPHRHPRGLCRAVGQAIGSVYPDGAACRRDASWRSGWGIGADAARGHRRLRTATWSAHPRPRGRHGRRPFLGHARRGRGRGDTPDRYDGIARLRASRTGRMLSGRLRPLRRSNAASSPTPTRRWRRRGPARTGRPTRRTWRSRAGRVRQLVTRSRSRRTCTSAQPIRCGREHQPLSAARRHVARSSGQRRRARATMENHATNRGLLGGCR